MISSPASRPKRELIYKIKYSIFANSNVLSQNCYSQPSATSLFFWTHPCKFSPAPAPPSHLLYNQIPMYHYNPNPKQPPVDTFAQLVRVATAGLHPSADPTSVVQGMSANLRQSGFNEYAVQVEREGYLRAGMGDGQALLQGLLEVLLTAYVGGHSLVADGAYYRVIGETVNGLFSTATGNQAGSYHQGTSNGSSTSNSTNYYTNTPGSRHGTSLPNQGQYQQGIGSFNGNMELPVVANCISLMTEEQIIRARFELADRLINSSNGYSAESAQQISDLRYSHINNSDMTTLEQVFLTCRPNTCRALQPIPYIAQASHRLNQALTRLQGSKTQQFAHLFSTVHKELSYAQQLLTTGESGTPGKFPEVQSWMVVLVHIYQCLAADYDPFRRRTLKTIFRMLVSDRFKDTIECLRWLESQRLEIKHLQPELNMDLRSFDEVEKLYHNRASFLPPSRTSISLYDYPKPILRLVNLSDPALPRKKVVNIWISGFLSEDMDKKTQWKALTDIMPDHEIYALEWQSDTIANLAKFIAGSCLNIITMREGLKQKFQNNPFTQAMQMSKLIGRYLAQLLLVLFPTQLINISGYSLGTDVIKACLERIVELGQQKMLNTIYLLGGVTDSVKFCEIIKRSSYPLRIQNLYTDNDRVLKNILSLCLPDVRPIGLVPIEQVPGHDIINQDCSSFVSGHLAYMLRFRDIGVALSMHEQ